MTETVNHSTGEITTVHPDEPGAVAMLTTAITALSTALDQMPIGEVVDLKAKVATVATATKELGMSKEAQELALEAVRRAEWALGRAIRKGQAEGQIRSQGDGRNLPGVGDPDVSKVTDFGRRDDLHGRPSRGEPGILTLAQAEKHELDEAITEAREEGNLSRANVVRKIECRTGRGEREGRTQRATRRAPLTDFAFDASTDLLRVAERLQRVVLDDRFKDNRQAIAQRAAGQINRAAELIAAAQAAINSETAP